jgi:hypothetical protein
MAQTCQHCGQTTADDARVMCPNCGRRMQPRSADAPPPPPEAPSPYAPPAAPAVIGQPAYAPYASVPASPADLGPPGVDVDFRRTTIVRTSRLTVLFRLVLAIPHLLALAVISVAAYVVVVVAWFAALFTARVPEGMYGFLGWVLRYGARVTAYVALLTDRWPSFSETPDDPVDVRLPGPQRLNRWAVLFRLILLIPAQIVLSVVTDGLVVIGFFVWVIALVLGRLPQPVFDVTASIVRYQTRYYSYGAMLTARYPGGLFGDPHDPTDAAGEGAELSPPRINRPAKRLLIVVIVVGALASLVNVGDRFNSADHSPDSTSVAPPSR